MRLLVVRHAIAVPHGTPEIPEDERPLTPKGEKRFRVAARGLARICRRPDVLLSSPLVRARQTADAEAQAARQQLQQAQASAAQSEQEKNALREKLREQLSVIMHAHVSID